MRAKRKLFFLSLLMVLMGASLTINPTPAFATSIYDNAYHTVDHISMGMYNTASGKSCLASGYDGRWREVFDDPAQWIYPAEFEEYHGGLEAAIENGGFVSIAQWAELGPDGMNFTSGIVIQFSDNEIEFPWHPDEVRRAAEYGVTTLMIVPRNALYLNGYCDPVVRWVDSWNNYPVSTHLQIDDLNTVTYGLDPGEGSFNVWKIQGVDPNYPTGYAGEMVTESVITSKPEYVAMGDSFSSGEGNPLFESGTDENGVDECHRSPVAYPHLLDSDPSLDLGSIAFVACSWATTDNVLYGGTPPGTSWSDPEPPQVDALSSDTQVVTITIGGDDVGFRDYALACTWDCDSNTTAYHTIVDNISSFAFANDLESTYEAILAAAPNAQVYVADYPYIAPSGAGTCALFDASTAYDVETLLNTRIAEAVGIVDDARLHYIDTNAEGSPFEGKDICGTDSDFYKMINPDPLTYSLHPNVQGQQDYATVIEQYISSH